jgi:uncharacterized protein YbjT (DUF2867 family)
MILVSGAAGKTGQAIVRDLVKAGVAVRAFVFRAEQAATVKTLGAQQVVAGDMRDGALYGQAAQGVTGLYHLCSNMNPAEVEIGRLAIAAAKQAGVARFVYHSVLHPQTEKMPHHWHKLRVEEALFESGLDFTILQPAAYMQNILAGWDAIVEQGRYRVPYPVETRLSLVDLEDVAQVAATVLTEAGHSQASYELAGAEAPSQSEIATILSNQLGQAVQAEPIPLEAWAAGARRGGLGPYQIETLSRMFRYYERYHFRGNANSLTWLLGRAPTSFIDFIKRTIQGKEFT